MADVRYCATELSQRDVVTASQDTSGFTAQSAQLTYGLSTPSSSNATVSVAPQPASASSASSSAPPTPAMSMSAP